MALQFSVLWQLVIFLSAAQHSLGAKFEYVLEDESIFSECLDPPPGYANISGLVDFSNVNLEMGPDGVHVRGYVTSTWDIQPKDRVEGQLHLLRFERGSWQPTILNMSSKDFCKRFLDPNQYWYDMFTRHIINQNDAQEKCMNYKGTVFYLEPYTFKMIFSNGSPLPPGRNRMVLHLVAVDENNVPRPNGICFEIKGDFYKME
ncbi:uncharacterized protein LOC6546216 [Drosophila erecta]|uniref:Uncharacterized protein n=1 Tax=Drosophila erecta TaxID=7220 RepID=B3NHS2_DROER|nr:uncharacterized protein LOC6546216 [Drosophila erecta]EDV51937.1 uncharacterized protein Dere_GG15791 [Drosophila erecta]